MKKTLITCVTFLFSFLFFTACTSHSCKIEERTDIAMTGKEKDKISSASKDLSSRVFVYKPDGSKQCESNGKIDLNIMKKELGNIVIFSEANKHDGMMRPQVCGAPTGYNNVYEIKLSDLETAAKLGFKKWLRD